MKIIIIGGTGLIGSKLAPLLRSRGQEVLQASPSRGVNAVTGEGLQAVLAGADVPYFGAPIALRALVPDDGARIMPTRFGDWLGGAAA
jgi:uncharacterized protein YbjT (DUF2867 family)